MRAQGLVSLVLPLLLLGWLSGLQACSGLPRVVVLHNPLTAEEHMALGTTYEAQGAQDLAAREYRAAMTDRADYAPALVALGNLAFDSGALDEAEEYYRRALASHPDHPGANNNLAMVYLKRGDRLDEAERLALKASAQSGSVRPYALDTLAHVYTRTGRYQEAHAALAEAEALRQTRLSVSGWPNHVKAWRQRGERSKPRSIPHGDRASRAFEKIASNIDWVSLPVKVFC